MKIQAGKEKVTIIPAKLTRNAPGKSANQKLRVAAYCRVSTDSEEQINSYKNQLAYYTEKINSKTEWKFAGIYADEGITGTSMKHREDFKRMLRACREGRIDLILCKSVSRFGRNSVDVLRTIRALRERGIGVMFEKEGVDTRTMNSELILAFHSAFSQSESESIRENVRRGLHMAYAQGTVTIPSNTYGFCEGENGDIAIDPEQAQVIRSIYQWFLDGGSLQIAKRPQPQGEGNLEHRHHPLHSLQCEVQGGCAAAKDLQAQPVLRTRHREQRRLTEILHCGMPSPNPGARYLRPRSGRNGQTGLQAAYVRKR